jgi:DtxR family transcriptional regulator, Mn-dependent transcriptional regulator
MSHSGIRHDPDAAQTEAVEDYAKAIYALARRDGEPVGTGALADRLGVSPGTATAMIKRLAELGIAEHEPYRGVRLTAAGERVALEVVRHHRLIEAYLAEALGMPWDRVHDEAEVLEHYISEDLEERIAAALGNPSSDPHGDPIPDRALAIAEVGGVALADLGRDEGGVFSRVSDSDPRMLRYLAERGIRPGAAVTVRDHEPFGGALMIVVDGTSHAIGVELAQRMVITEPRRAGQGRAGEGRGAR